MHRHVSLFASASRHGTESETADLLGTRPADPPDGIVFVVHGVPVAHHAEEKCGGGGGGGGGGGAAVPVVTAAPAPESCGQLPPALAAEMAKHGLTEKDQRQLFQREGFTTVDRFKGLRDDSYPTNIDIGARRESKRQIDQAAAQARHDRASRPARERHIAACLEYNAACLEQVRRALLQAELIDTAPVAAIIGELQNKTLELALKHPGADVVDAFVTGLRRLADDRGALEALGVGAYDGQQLRAFCRGGRVGPQLVAPVLEVVEVEVEVVLTEPERQEVERQAAAERKVALLFCGMAVQEVGWWIFDGDLRRLCAVGGGVLALVGAVGFLCAPGHSKAWIGRPYTGLDLGQKEPDKIICMVALLVIWVIQALRIHLDEDASPPWGMFHFRFVSMVYLIGSSITLLGTLANECVRMQSI